MEKKRLKILTLEIFNIKCDKSGFYDKNIAIMKNIYPHVTHRKNNHFSFLIFFCRLKSKVI